MKCHNNATRIRREVLIRIAQAFLQNNLEEDAGKIPNIMRPKNGKTLRCCIYKAREVLRYRCMAALGIEVESETDDSTPMQLYVQQALNRERIKGPVMTVLDIACQGCVPSRYLVTEACQGCTAQICIENCSFDAIRFQNGRSYIDPEKCRNCGKCAKVCPFSAITRIPVPCEEACPVGAIRKNEEGKAQIDFAACTSCGRCMTNCPFGAVMERSQMIDVLKNIHKKKKVVAMIAPAIAGQFPGTPAQIVDALRQMGFSNTVEVALGADDTAQEEAREFTHKMSEGQAFMTTSCCPAYAEAVRKHVPALMPFVSSTPTPMHFTAARVRREFPDAVTVFIGPCIAKKSEAMHDPLVDYVLTFEELGAMLVAFEIEVEKCADAELTSLPSAEARSFAISGGVAAAVGAALPEGAEMKPYCINGLDKKSLKLLEAFTRGKCPGNLVEVMACEGGCVAGAGVVGNTRVAAKAVTAWSAQAGKS